MEAVSSDSAMGRLAIVVGDPSEPGPYAIRVKVTSSVKLMPHQHPEDRVYRVISDVFYIGLGSVSMKRGCRHIHREPSLCSPVEPRTSTG